MSLQYLSGTDNRLWNPDLPSFIRADEDGVLVNFHNRSSHGVIVIREPSREWKLELDLVPLVLGIAKGDVVAWKPATILGTAAVSAVRQDENLRLGVPIYPLFTRAANQKKMGVRPWQAPPHPAGQRHYSNASEFLCVRWLCEPFPGPLSAADAGVEAEAP